jgi:GNAT superfamily N-acetyltransferase
MTAESISSESLATVLDFQRQTVKLVADEVLDIDEGWLVRTPSLPDVWWLNHLRIRVPISYEHVKELCRRHLLSRFDQVFLEGEAGGDRVARKFRARGWEVDVDLHSVLVHDPDRGADRLPGGRVLIIEPGMDETLALMERWLVEEETLRLTSDGLRQLVESMRLVWGARRGVRLGVRGPGGRLLAMTHVFSDGRVAQVEDVYAVPEARGRGYGRALVARAVEVAHEGGHELTFIVADDNDWPKQLYAKVGFEPVGRSWLLHRQVGR